MSITKKIIYPPESIIKPSTINKDFEYIILWMLNSNEECKWAHFLTPPINISQATLSKYINILIEKEFVKKEKKGVYKITPTGNLRFAQLQNKEKSDTGLNYPPDLILRRRNYDHTILWFLYNNSTAKWSDFVESPLSINQSSLSKTINRLLDFGYIKKTDNREYSITIEGETEYLRMLKEYDLDRQSILDQESKRIEVITEKTSQFFSTYNIEDKNVKYRFLNMILKLDYTKVEDISNKEDFNKVLLYLSINHPDQYPNYISPEKFAIDYKLDAIILKFFLRKIVDEKDIYPIKFFKLETKDGKFYYFQEEEKIEKILKSIVEDYITQYTYLNRFHEKTNGSEIIKIKDVMSNILDEVSPGLFDTNLRESLEIFLPTYINYLAYKIETHKSLTDVSDRLKTFTFTSFKAEFQPFSGPGALSINAGNESHYSLNTEILETLEPVYLNKADFLNIINESSDEHFSFKNSELFLKIGDIISQDKPSKLEEFYHENRYKLTDIEDQIVNDIMLTLKANYNESIAITSKIILNEPKLFIGYLFQSLTYFEMGEFNKALEEIEHGLEFSNNILLSLHKAQILMIQNHYDDARKLIDGLLDMYPDQIWLLRERSLIPCQENDCSKMDKSLEYINKALTLRPNDKRLLIIKVFSLMYEEKYNQAKKFIKKELGFNYFTKNSRFDTASLFTLIFCYVAQGKIEKALNIAHELNIQFPNHPTSHLANAFIQGYNLIYKLTEQKSDLDNFTDLIENAVTLEPIRYRQARFYQLSSLIFYGIREIEKAITEIDKSIELDHYNYDYILTKIYILTEKEDSDEVFKFIDQNIKLFPEKKARSLIIKSFIYHYKGMKIDKMGGNKEKVYDYYCESLKILDDVLEEYPDHPLALNNKVISLAALDKQDEAIEAGKKLITLYPEVGNHFDSFAEVLMQFGKYQEAIEQFTRAIEIDPHGFYVYLSYNKMAICYKELEDYERALEVAEKSKEIADKLLPGEKDKYDYNIDLLIEELKELLENKKK